MSTPTNKEENLPTLRAAFRTTVSSGQDGRYTMQFAFQSLDEMHLADDEWHKFITVATTPSAECTFNEWCKSKGLTPSKCDETNLWIREAFESGKSASPSADNRAADALQNIRDCAYFDATPSGDAYYRKAENALAAIECRDAMEKPATSPSTQHWLDSPQTSLGGKTAREGYAANPEYAGLYAASPSVQGESIDSPAFRNILATWSEHNEDWRIRHASESMNGIIAHINQWHRARLAHTAAPSKKAAEEWVHENISPDMWDAAIEAFHAGQASMAAPSEGLAVPTRRGRWNSDRHSVIDHCWRMYQQGQISADHTAKEVFAGTLVSFADWLAAPATEQAKPELANEKLDSIKAALNEYYDALTARQHGGVAQSTAFNKIEQIMGTSWHDRKIEVTNK